MIKSNNKMRFFAAAALICAAVFAWEFSFPADVSARQDNRSRTTAATPTPAAKPSPNATPTATPVAKPVHTLIDLQAKVRSILQRPQLQRGQIGIKAVSLDSGKVLFEENAEKYFMPASNMKSFTISAALMKLSPNFRFVTSVTAAAMPDNDGTVKGDLTIYGRGDPSISTVFNNGDYYKGMQNLADRIVQSGVKKIEGSLVGDESYFSGDAVPIGWEWDDLQWFYGAEVSALSINNNAVDLTVRPGSSPGAPCAANYQPLMAGIVLINKCVTHPAGAARDLTVVRRLGQNTIELTGGMPHGDSAFVGYVAVSRPAQFFIAMLRQLLEQKGVVITGQNRVIDARDKASLITPMVMPVEITKLESPPLSVIAAETMKPSQNLYTEMVLRAMGESIGNKSNARSTSYQRGAGVVSAFLKEAGVAPDGIVMYDASGLSRHNLVTPAALVQLYIFMSKGPYAAEWRNSLPIGGVDGTLKGRFRSGAGNNNIRAKTGTIDQVSGLTGYLTTAGGERLVFSIIFNGIVSQNTRENTIDEIAATFANFSGKSN